MSDTRIRTQAVAAGALVMSCHHVQLPLACFLLDSLYHLLQLVKQFQLKWYHGKHLPGRHAFNNQISRKSGKSSLPTLIIHACINLVLRIISREVSGGLALQTMSFRLQILEAFDFPVRQPCGVVPR